MTRARIAQCTLFLLAFGGAFSSGALVFRHLRTDETCPMIGSVPACLIIFLGYVVICISPLFLAKSLRRRFFLIGWIPVTGFALFGVISEILGHNICPPGAFGLPQCVYSLAMALFCLILFILAQQSNSDAEMLKGT